MSGDLSESDSGDKTPRTPGRWSDDEDRYGNTTPYQDINIDDAYERMSIDGKEQAGDIDMGSSDNGSSASYEEDPETSESYSETSESSYREEEPEGDTFMDYDASDAKEEQPVFDIKDDIKTIDEFFKKNEYVIIRVLDENEQKEHIAEQVREILLKQPWKTKFNILGDSSGELLDLAVVKDEHINQLTKPLSENERKKYAAAWPMSIRRGGCADPQAFHLKKVWEVRQNKKLSVIAKAIMKERHITKKEERVPGALYRTSIMTDDELPDDIWVTIDTSIQQLPNDVHNKWTSTSLEDAINDKTEMKRLEGKLMYTDSTFEFVSSGDDLFAYELLNKWNTSEGTDGYYKSSSKEKKEKHYYKFTAGIAEEYKDRKQTIVVPAGCAIFWSQHLLYKEQENPTDRIQFGMYLGYRTAKSRKNYNEISKIDELDDRLRCTALGVAPKLYPNLEPVEYPPMKPTNDMARRLDPHWPGLKTKTVYGERYLDTLLPVAKREYTGPLLNDLGKNLLGYKPTSLGSNSNILSKSVGTNIWKKLALENRIELLVEMDVKIEYEPKKIAQGDASGDEDDRGDEDDTLAGTLSDAMKKMKEKIMEEVYKEWRCIKEYDAIEVEKAIKNHGAEQYFHKKGAKGVGGTASYENEFTKWLDKERMKEMISEIKKKKTMRKKRDKGEPKPKPRGKNAVQELEYEDKEFEERAKGIISTFTKKNFTNDTPIKCWKELQSNLTCLRNKTFPPALSSALKSLITHFNNPAKWNIFYKTCCSAASVKLTQRENDLKNKIVDEVFEKFNPDGIDDIEDILEDVMTTGEEKLLADLIIKKELESMYEKWMHEEDIDADWKSLYGSNDIYDNISAKYTKKLISENISKLKKKKKNSEDFLSEMKEAYKKLKEKKDRDEEYLRDLDGMIQHWGKGGSTTYQSPPPIYDTLRLH